MRTEHASVAIIGGGPAGTTTAILLKQHRPAARIVLIERDRFPRHRVGESTLPDANPVLLKLGALETLENAGFVRKGGITYKWRNDQPIFSEDFAKGVLREGVPDHSWQVDRSRYDDVLLRRAAEVGVEIWQPASVVDVVGDRNRVEGVVVSRDGGERVTIRSEFVVDCSGQRRLLGRLLKLAEHEHQLGDLAIYRYYRGATWLSQYVGTPELSKIFFAATPAGWIWFIPLARDLTSVGLVTRREFVQGRGVDEVLDEQLALVEEISTALRPASVCQAPGSDDPPGTLTTQNWSYSHDEVAGPGWYLAGDSAAFVDPILSSGLLLAHRAGLSVANAIRTEWDHPEIDPTALRKAYNTFYADLCAGFITMAEWWYHQRDAGIQDWWKRAAALSRKGRVSNELDDLSAFMHFAAGYLTDFRFTHIGPAFGAEGLGIAVDGLTGTPGAGGALLGRIADRTRSLVPQFDRVEPETYLTTYVETHRWWDLPAVRFFTGDVSKLYRPPVRCDADGTPRPGKTIRALEALIESCDGTRCYDDLMAAAILRLGTEDDQTTRDVLGVVLSDLLSLGVISAEGPVSHVGSRARRDIPRGQIVRKAFDRVQVTTRAAVKLGHEGGVEGSTLFKFESSSGSIGYRPPFAVRSSVSVPSASAASMVQDVIAAVDGVRSLESVVRSVLSKRPATDSLAKDLANVVVADLVSLGVISLSS